MDADSNDQKSQADKRKRTVKLVTSTPSVCGPPKGRAIAAFKLRQHRRWKSSKHQQNGGLAGKEMPHGNGNTPDGDTQAVFSNLLQIIVRAGEEKHRGMWSLKPSKLERIRMHGGRARWCHTWRVERRCTEGKELQPWNVYGILGFLIKGNADGLQKYISRRSVDKSNG